MEDLDKRLGHVIKDIETSASLNVWVDTKVVIEEMRQIFVDAGWKELRYTTPEDIGMQAATAGYTPMTGQEFYDRFTNHLLYAFGTGIEHDEDEYLSTDDIIKIAMKAAGIEQ